MTEAFFLLNDAKKGLRRFQGDQYGQSEPENDVIRKTNAYLSRFI